MVSSLGMLAGCALIMLVGMSDARAAGGRIVFSGAVVEPTCPVDGASAVRAISTNNGLMQDRLTCGQTATDLGRSYSRSVISLSEVAVADDRLLGYFAGYVRDDRARDTQAKLIVRVYE